MSLIQDIRENMLVLKMINNLKNNIIHNIMRLCNNICKMECPDKKTHPIHNRHSIGKLIPDGNQFLREKQRVLFKIIFPTMNNLH